MTGDPVMVSGVHWAPQHSKRAWKTAGSWQEQEGGEAAAGVQDLRATGDPCSVGDLVTHVGGGDRLCFLQVTDPRGWESMEDMAGGHQGIRKSASVVCGRLAFLVQCGRPQGGWRHSRGGRVPWGDPGSSAGRQEEPLPAPGDLPCTPARVYKHPITSDYKPLVQLG